MTGIAVGDPTGTAVGEGSGRGVAVGDGAVTVGVGGGSVGDTVGWGVAEGTGVGVSVACSAGTVGVGAFRGAVCAHAARAVDITTASTSPRFRTLARFSKSHSSQETLVKRTHDLTQAAR